ncbi:MAG: hypothetical protein L0H19_05445 [Salinisphaera sp.]|nr:hypothetical protein [Salinisphaera sp.]
MLLSLLLLGACAVMKPVTSHDPGLPGFAYTLANADGNTLEQTLAATQKSWQTHPTARGQARLGLTRGQWGYDGYDPAAAAEHLAKALQHAESWPSYDRAFVRWRLVQLQHAIDSSDQQGALAAKNQQLQQRLDEARGKLRAITEIERELGKTQ